MSYPVPVTGLVMFLPQSLLNEYEELSHQDDSNKLCFSEE